MKKILVLFVIVILNLSCSSDNSIDFIESFGGYYKITSIKSDLQIDMNNDGIKSNDLYYEISSPHIISNGQSVVFYDFESIGRYMEVRPTKVQTNNAQLINFAFPHQRIGYLSDNTPYLAEYLKSFINYIYEINNDKIILINGYPGEIEDVGEVLTLEVLSNNVLKIKIIKNIFDFSTKEWIRANLEVDYLKMDN